MEASRRLKYVKERKGCTNCLNSSHTYSNCSSTYTCRHCKLKHHSLLHKDDTDKSARSATELQSVTEPAVNKSLPETVKSEPPVIAFLHTALVKAVNGPRECQARIALDTGAFSSLITEALASQLHLKRHPQRLQVAAEPYLKDLCLADPSFGGQLDALIGSLDYGKCVLGSLTYNISTDIVVQPTLFGWTSTTTKVRPVFDASAKSSTGVSLNDLLYTGPNLYQLQTDILLRFRTHKIGFSADISKMFREVWLHEDERDFHCFLLQSSG